MRTIRLLVLGALLSCGLSLTSSARFVGIGVAPASIISIAFTPPTGTLSSGTYPLSVCFGAPVTVAGGIPTLPLATLPLPSSATYASGSGGKCHTYNYPITTNALANPVSTTSAGIVPNGATLTDANGHAAILSGAQNIPFPGLAFAPAGSAPAIISVASSCSGTVSWSPTSIQHCVISVTFNVAVFVGGSWVPELNLATSPVPAIAYLCDDVDAVRTAPSWKWQCGGLGAGSGTPVLNFGYTVWGGQNASPVALSPVAFNLNGSTLQNSTGVAATLTGANSAVISGWSLASGNAYCLNSSTGSDSNTGLCGVGAADHPFKTLAKAQSAMRGGAVKTVFAEAGSSWGAGTPSGGNFTTNTGVSFTAYILQTSADNGEVWAPLPGASPVPIIDGGCPQSSGNVPNPAIPNCTFAAFESNGASFITVRGFEIAHFFGAAFYDYTPSNHDKRNNYIHDIYNTCGAASGGDSSSCNGAKGAASIFTYWTNYDFSHNKLLNTAGMAYGAVSGANGTPAGNNGFSMTESVDLNSILDYCIGNPTLGVSTDCGGIYLGWFPGNNLAGLPSGTIQATENIAGNDTGVVGAGVAGIYLDDLGSAAKLVGNIVWGAFANAFEVNDGGKDVTVANNIIDMTVAAPYGNGRISVFDTPLYLPAGAVQNPPGGPSITQSPAIAFNLNVLFNGNDGANGGAGDPPPNYMGTVPVNAGQPGAPNLGPNYYRTEVGSFTTGFPWGNFNSPTGITNTSGVTLASNPFVNPTAHTAAGYQLNPLSSGGAAAIAGGVKNVAMNQGLQ